MNLDIIAQNMLNISYNNANLIVSNILPLVHSNTYKDVRLELKKKWFRFICFKSFITCYVYGNISANL